MGKNGIFRPSTRAFMREARQLRDYSLFDLIHGYVYARWTYFYIALGSGYHPLSKRLAPLLSWIGKLIVRRPASGGNLPALRFEDTYHGKVVPLAAAAQLVSVREEIDLGDLEQIIPYERARDLILKNPDHIAVLECPCRVARPNPCLPLDVCLIIGEPFAGFVVEHHSKRARWITSEEAQEILKAEEQRGHVHHAFFKDAMLGRFYAICNCCSCCCGAIQAQRNGTPMLASSGYVAQVDEYLCEACGRCETVCQFEAIRVDEKAVVDFEKCMGCGACTSQCHCQAIRLVRTPDKGRPLEIQALIEEYQRGENN